MINGKINYKCYVSLPEGKALHGYLNRENDPMDLGVAYFQPNPWSSYTECSWFMVIHPMQWNPKITKYTNPENGLIAAHHWYTIHLLAIRLNILIGGCTTPCKISLSQGIM
jgi:hypothetical protein